MSNFISVFTSFISQLAQVELFLYVLAAFAIFGVVLLIRKAIYK